MPTNRSKANITSTEGNGRRYFSSFILAFILICSAACNRRKIIRHEEWIVLDVFYNESNRTLIVKGRNIKTNEVLILIVPNFGDLQNEQIKTKLLDTTYDWEGSAIIYNSIEQEYYHSDSKNGFLYEDAIQFFGNRPTSERINGQLVDQFFVHQSRPYRSSKIIPFSPEYITKEFIRFRVSNWKNLKYEERYEYLMMHGT